MKKFLYIVLVLLLSACGNTESIESSVNDTAEATSLETTTLREITEAMATTVSVTTSVPMTTIAESIEPETSTEPPSTTNTPESTTTATMSPPETTTAQATTMAETTTIIATTAAETTTEPNNGPREFTLKELGTYTGLDGVPAYLAYKGIVYDVSHIGDWAGGEHYGNYAGYDLTDDLAYASHGEEKLNKAIVVGVLVK